MWSPRSPAGGRYLAARGRRVRIGRLVALAALALVAVAGWGCAENIRGAGRKAPLAPTPTLQDELAALREQQEALRHGFEQVVRSLEALERSAGVAGQRIATNLSSIEKLYGKVSELSEGLKTVRGRLDEVPTSTAEPAEEEATLRQRYAEAYSSFKAGEYFATIERFRGFVEQYPQSRLADNAQYWIAESYLALRDYHRALKEYRKVERNYPNGNRVPDAILRGGRALYALEDIPGYVRELKRVIHLFPRDRAAQVAAQSIAQLVSE